MKPIIFPKSFRFLIITMLLIAMLFNRKLSQQLMLATILIWIVLTVCSLVGSKIMTLPSFIRVMYAKCRELIAKIHRQAAPANETPEATISPVPSYNFSVQQKQEQKRMLQHISLRITEKMKSAYPDATWLWEKEPCLSDVLEGKTVRIVTHDMDIYTHADVRFDQFARIHITPLVIGEFAVEGDSDTVSDVETKEPPVVDVRSWYDLIGKQVLEDIITNLNANGHTRLSIKENGEIVITHNKKEFLKGTLKQFPPKNYWNELLSLLEEYELQGKAEKDHIVLYWT